MYAAHLIPCVSLPASDYGAAGVGISWLPQGRQELAGRAGRRAHLAAFGTLQGYLRDAPSLAWSPHVARMRHPGASSDPAIPRVPGELADRTLLSQ